MPSPPPPEETRWKEGQSGNPNGYSRGRRISDRLIKIIEDRGLDETIAITLLGAALGDSRLLKDRKPNYQFFAMLLDRIEGKVRTQEDETSETTSPLIDTIREAFGQSKSD